MRLLARVAVFVCSSLCDSVTCSIGRCVCPAREDLLKGCWVPTVGWKCTSSRMNNITLSTTWKSPSYSGIQGEAGLWACLLYSITEALGLMSLMQIWTKLYSQVGRPLPKVQMPSTSFFVTNIYCSDMFLKKTVWISYLPYISLLDESVCFYFSFLERFLKALPCDSTFIRGIPYLIFFTEHTTYNRIT